MELQAVVLALAQNGTIFVRTVSPVRVAKKRSRRCYFYLHLLAYTFNNFLWNNIYNKTTNKPTNKNTMTKLLDLSFRHLSQSTAVAHCMQPFNRTGECSPAVQFLNNFNSTCVRDYLSILNRFVYLLLLKFVRSVTQNVHLFYPGRLCP